LIVTDRPRAPYQKVAVAADFSPVSGQALALTTQLFPEQQITVVHGYQPLATYAASNIEAHNDQFRQVAETNYAEWLAKLDIPPSARERVVPKIELGDPPRLLRDAAEHGMFDLLVIGTRGRGRIFEFFLGSVAKRILAELPCDALFVRESQLPALAVPLAPSAN
jgi:nucleotide-binding universal stress UspA family protein